jgi:hypothetical protein
MDISEREGLLELRVLLLELHCDEFVETAKTEHVGAR